MTTFATPYGWFRWLHVLFGLNVSSEILKAFKVLRVFPGVKCITDDVFIYGTDKADHDRDLAIFMYRCQHKGIKLNSQKLEFNAKKFHFMDIC